MTTFWSTWICVLTIGSLIGLTWLLIGTRKGETKGSVDQTMGHSFDGIEEYDNPLPQWWFMLFAGTLGLLAGVIAALKRGSLFDHGVMGISLTGYSMPIFWWGLILIMFFSVSLGWTPVSGRIDLLYDIEPRTGFMLIDTLLADEPDAFWDALHHLILPAIVLGTIPLAVIARMTRSSMLEVLREDYIRTARAKGLSPARVVFVHGLRNALIPVLTVVGLQVGTLLAGAVLTETIFSWPGIGKWLIEAIGARDYPVVQNGILLIACLVILVNFVVDILYGFANPRIRHQR